MLHAIWTKQNLQANYTIKTLEFFDFDDVWRKSNENTTTRFEV
jgi:hypothetical protein